MTKLHKNTVLLFLLLCFVYNSNAQEYSIDIIIKNAPDNIIFLGTVKGDNYTLIDSTSAKDELIQFKLNNSDVAGIYRIKLGYTSERNKTNDSPQLIDIIFNKENVVLESDFYSPEPDTRVIQSDENEIWLDFKGRESELSKSITTLEKELNYNWTIDNSEKAIKIATEYNQLQIERDLFISQSVKKAENLFSAKLIETYREPLLDGYLTKTQRNLIFQKEYLNAINFGDEALINSQVLTDKIFLYLISYNQSNLSQAEREKAYLNAVETVFSKLNENQAVFEFIKEYLIHGFEVLQMPNVAEVISEKEFKSAE